MSRQTGKGSHRRKEAALERKATQHHEFVGEADAERAEAKRAEKEHLEAERSAETVREMATELEREAGLRENGAMGPEIPFRMPRSIDEGKRLIREAPEAMREKARERLSKLPEPAQKAIGIADSIAGLMMIPVRLSIGIAREFLQVPMAMIRVLRGKEA